MKPVSPLVLYWEPRLTVPSDWIRQALGTAVPTAELLVLPTADAILRQVEELDKAGLPLPSLLLLPPGDEQTVALVAELKSRERLRMMPAVAFTCGEVGWDALYRAQANCCIAVSSWSVEAADVLPQVFYFWLRIAMLAANVVPPGGLARGWLPEENRRLAEAAQRALAAFSE